MATVVGTSLVIAAACVCNNYIDRTIDARMQRTKDRALVSGLISARSAVVFAAVLGIMGFILLARFTNYLVVIIGALAFIDYVILYGFTKRRWSAGTLIGSLSGAAPIAAGYVAVTGRFDGAAIVLTLIMIVWQMPHFYAIAIYRRDDYRAAGIPVLSVTKGQSYTQHRIINYVILYLAVCSLLYWFGFVGVTYIVGITLINGYWLYRGLRPSPKQSIDTWARSMFGASLVAVLALSVLLAAGPRLP